MVTVVDVDDKKCHILRRVEYVNLTNLQIFLCKWMLTCEIRVSLQ